MEYNNPWIIFGICSLSVFVIYFAWLGVKNIKSRLTEFTTKEREKSKNDIETVQEDIETNVNEDIDVYTKTIPIKPEHYIEKIRDDEFFDNDEDSENTNIKYGDDESIYTDDDDDDYEEYGNSTSFNAFNLLKILPSIIGLGIVLIVGATVITQIQSSVIFNNTFESTQNNVSSDSIITLFPGFQLLQWLYLLHSY